MEKTWTKVSHHHALKRLATIEGHVRGIRRMIEDDVYWGDILRQTYAVQRAVTRLEDVVLQGHFSYGWSRKRSDEIIGEFLQLFRLRHWHDGPVSADVAPADLLPAAREPVDGVHANANGPHDEELQRILTVEEQLKTVRDMIERDAQCTEIVQHTDCVHRWIGSLEEAIVRGYVNSAAFRAKPTDEIIAELATVFQSQR